MTYAEAVWSVGGGGGGHFDFFPNSKQLQMYRSATMHSMRCYIMVEVPGGNGVCHIICHVSFIIVFLDSQLVYTL